MKAIPEDYLEKLPPVYRDILRSFPEVEPARRKEYGLAFQTIHAHLAPRYSLGQIRAACTEMQRHGVVEIRNEIFAHPTELGEELIAQLTGHTAPELVPPFPPLPTP